MIILLFLLVLSNLALITALLFIDEIRIYVRHKQQKAIQDEK